MNTPQLPSRLGNPRICSTDQSAAVGLIVNADDWGRDRKTTDRIVDCFRQGALSSTSAMVFMSDADRAAEVARSAGLDVGLHLNLTEPFSQARLDRSLQFHHSSVSRYLRSGRLAEAVFHPLLVNSFRYIVAAQIDEFARLYACQPTRIDGHHHMHLCANVLLGGLLPTGSIVRRSFSFFPGEKPGWNVLYRRSVNSLLARNHTTRDYFFAMTPLLPEVRLRRIADLARTSTVELETHPAIEMEYRFLMRGGLHDQTQGVLPVTDRIGGISYAIVTADESSGKGVARAHLTSVARDSGAVLPATSERSVAAGDAEKYGLFWGR
jgi:chitin disaccharide deacetylase